MSRLIVVFMLFCGVAWAEDYDWRNTKTLEWVAGDVDADITYSEMFRYYKKIEQLVEAWCADLPVHWGEPTKGLREKVCDE